jgi:hypothetical protein
MKFPRGLEVAITLMAIGLLTLNIAGAYSFKISDIPVMNETVSSYKHDLIIGLHQADAQFQGGERISLNVVDDYMIVRYKMDCGGRMKIGNMTAVIDLTKIDPQEIDGMDFTNEDLLWAEAQTREHFA